MQKFNHPLEKKKKKKIGFTFLSVLVITLFSYIDNKLQKGSEKIGLSMMSNYNSGYHTKETGYPTGYRIQNYA